jgi:CBS domain-containing protein
VIEEMGSFKCKGWVWLGIKGALKRAGKAVYRGVRDLGYGLMPPHAMSIPIMPKAEPFNTVTTFDGSDLVVTINGRVIGELQAITWDLDKEKEQNGEFPVHGSLVFVLFDRDIARACGFDLYSKPINELPPMDIELRLANEYGQIMTRKIVGVLLTKVGYAISIDDILTEEVYKFKASSMTPWETSYIDKSND